MAQGLTAGNVLLLAGSVLAAVCALFWPQIEQAYVAYISANSSRHTSGQTAAGGAKGKCPLGYEGAMPSNHPPVPGSLLLNSKAVAGQKQQQQQQLVTFANAVIWTADVEAPWAVNMTVNLATGDIMHMGVTGSSDSSDSGGSSGSSSSTGSSSSSSGGVIPSGRVIDMQGAFLMPGFVDPHVHLIPGGLSLHTVNLRGLKGGRQELADRLAAAAAALPQAAAAGSSSTGSSDGSSSEQGRQAWLIGVGWSESDWEGGQLPDRSWIDEACDGRPAFLSRMDSHMALVNTAALQAAGLIGTEQQQQPDKEGSRAAAAVAAVAAAAADAEGLIDRDPHTGLPTGLLRESAMQLVEGLIPPPSVADKAAALQEAGRYLLSQGVTSVGDMGWGLFGSGSTTWEDLEGVYDQAAAAAAGGGAGQGAAAAAGGGGQEGKDNMPVRVSAYMPLRTWRRLASRVAAQGTSHPHSSRLTWGGVKEFADGSLGSNTALMWEPYEDSSTDGGGSDSGGGSSSNGGNRTGTRTIPTEELLELVKGAAGAGLQVAVHAIGDRAVDEVTQVFETALENTGSSSSSSSSSSKSKSGSRQQHRIEHVQHVSSPAAAAKMAALGLAGVPNPQHLLSDRPMLVSKLGVQRSGPGRAFAYKTLADAGVSLGFGSDWPVVEIDPWASVFAAVYRRDPPPSTTKQQAAGGSEGDVVSERVWESENERLNLSEVLLGHTLHAARVARLDHWVGKLAPGLKADFIVLSHSPFGGGDSGGGGGHISSSRSDGAAAAVNGDGASAPLLLQGLPVVQQTYMDGVCVFGCDGAGDGGVQEE